MTAPESGYVSRGGLKLRHALDTFSIDPFGVVCADLGCSTGGFTDCLLRARAARVICVDTAYGQLAWKLRNDPRVTVMERTNALHAEPAESVGLVVIDLGWTPQRLALPAAARWLIPTGRIVTLIKPHYERTGEDSRSMPRGGVLDDAEAEAVVERVLREVEGMGFRVHGLTRSPILGGGSRRKNPSRGNPEWLAWTTPPGSG